MNVCVSLLAALALVAGASGSSGIRAVSSAGDSGEGGDSTSRESDRPAVNGAASASVNAYKPIGYDNAYKPIGYDNAYKPIVYDNAYTPIGYDNADKLSGYDDAIKPSGYDNAYQPGGYDDNSYGPSLGYAQSAYSQHSSHGHDRYHSPSHFKAYIVHLPTRDGPPDQLGKQLLRVQNVHQELKKAHRQYGALASRQALQKALLDRLVTLVLQDLQGADNTQNNTLDRLETLLDALENRLNTLLPNSTGELDVQNQDNLEELQRVEQLLADLLAVENQQSGDIAELVTDVRDFETRLSQIRRNEFELLSDAVERTAARRRDVEAKESRRMCETGRVTVDSCERKVQYAYQTPFQTVPQVTLGICGYDFDVNVIEDPFGFLKTVQNYLGGYGNGYGQHPPPVDPNVIGSLVTAVSSETGLRIEGFDLSFGDTEGVDVKVCFQACSIGPGIGPVEH